MPFSWKYFGNGCVTRCAIDARIWYNLPLWHPSFVAQTISILIRRMVNASCRSGVCDAPFQIDAYVGEQPSSWWRQRVLAILHVEYSRILHCRIILVMITDSIAEFSSRVYIHDSIKLDLEPETTPNLRLYLSHRHAASGRCFCCHRESAEHCKHDIYRHSRVFLMTWG